MSLSFCAIYCTLSNGGAPTGKGAKEGAFIGMDGRNKMGITNEI